MPEPRVQAVAEALGMEVTAGAGNLTGVCVQIFTPFSSFSTHVSPLGTSPSQPVQSQMTISMVSKGDGFYPSTSHKSSMEGTGEPVRE